MLVRTYKLYNLFPYQEQEQLAAEAKIARQEEDKHHELEMEKDVMEPVSNVVLVN